MMKHKMCQGAADYLFRCSDEKRRCSAPSATARSTLCHARLNPSRCRRVNPRTLGGPGCWQVRRGSYKRFSEAYERVVLVRLLLEIARDRYKCPYTTPRCDLEAQSGSIPKFEGSRGTGAE